MRQHADGLFRQGRFDILLHKLTDELCKYDDGDATAVRLIQDFEVASSARFLRPKEYVRKCTTSLVVIDPLERVRVLLDRRTTCRTMAV